MLIRRRALTAGLFACLGLASPLAAQPLPSVEQTEVRQDGIVGRFHALPGARARAAVILLGGSEGGLPPAKDADDLARSGYPTLALGYFKAWNGQPEGLPASLIEIPLEYFFRALDWLKRQPQVDPERIVLMGQSRGGELVLLLGSQRPDVAGVIAFSPSDRVWSGIYTSGPPVGPPRAAWTLAGKPLPFQKFAPQPNGSMREGFARAQPDEAARIPVERIRGPVLLLSSRTDLLWPSDVFADEAAAALAKRPGPPRVENLKFDNASHLLMGTGGAMTQFKAPGTSFVIEFGGTAEGTVLARAAAWAAAKRFLARI